MSVLEIIEETREHPPMNEGTTCDWVILPILLELGYGRRDIVSRVADNNGQFPDYTILPDTDHTWFLEAKAWNVSLHDNHAAQSLNYANHNGRRWVVLTNGQVWRLYDNAIQGTSTEKLVVSIAISPFGDLDTLLHALGRDSVVSGGLERYAANSRLASELSAQLRDENSEVVRAIRTTLRRRPGLGGVTCGSIVGYFGQAPVPPPMESQSHSAEGPIPISAPEAVSTGSGGHIQSLGHVATHAEEALFRSGRTEGTRRAARRPCSLTMPDNSVTPVRYWWELAVAIANWLFEQVPSTPVPFARTGGNELFTNFSGQHVGHPMRNPREITAGGRHLYLETHYSAENLLTSLVALCEAAGVDPDTITITLAE